MKKLNLQLGSIKEMLTKEQMKKVSGGYVGTRCEIFCCTGGPGTCSSGDSYDHPCDTNEECQAWGNENFTCQSGTYLAALCKS